MIKYICNNCNKIECETSICPICKQRTQISKLDFYMISEIITFEEKGRFGKEKYQNLGVKVKVAF